VGAGGKIRNAMLPVWFDATRWLSLGANENDHLLLQINYTTSSFPDIFYDSDNDPDFAHTSILDTPPKKRKE
jgi:hypothetical protein